MTPNASLLVIDAHGVYVPQYFVQSYENYFTPKSKSRLSEQIHDVKQGPDHDFYWDSWCDILDGAVLIDDTGAMCGLYQDGDLWAIPVNEVELISEF